MICVKNIMLNMDKMNDVTYHQFHVSILGKNGSLNFIVAIDGEWLPYLTRSPGSPTDYKYNPMISYVALHRWRDSFQICPYKMVVLSTTVLEQRREKHCTMSGLVSDCKLIMIRHKKDMKQGTTYLFSDRVAIKWKVFDKKMKYRIGAKVSLWVCFTS